MDGANGQPSQHLVQPVGLVGGLTDGPGLDAHPRVTERVKGVRGAGCGEVGKVVGPHRHAGRPSRQEDGRDGAAPASADADAAANS